MLILMGYIHLDPFDVDAFITDVEQTSRSTKAEKGCLFYSITLDDRSAGRFLVAERWQDQPSLAAHLEKVETLAFLDTWGDRMNSDSGRMTFQENGHSLREQAISSTPAPDAKRPPIGRPFRIR